jgi:hypothetical protein
MQKYDLIGFAHVLHVSRAQREILTYRKVVKPLFMKGRRIYCLQQL